jgi:hypothetical protein
MPREINGNILWVNSGIGQGKIQGKGGKFLFFTRDCPVYISVGDHVRARITTGRRNRPRAEILEVLPKRKKKKRIRRDQANLEQ